MMIKSILTICAVLALTGCDAAGRDPAGRATAPLEPTVSDSAGVTIYEHPGDALERAPRIMLDSAPMAVFAGDVADPEKDISTVGNGTIRAMPNGDLVGFDRAPGQLVFFHTRTGQVTRVGRRGEGPGEWQLAMAITAGPGNTAYVTDPQLRKVHVVDATGKITSTMPFPGADGDNAGARIMSIPRGTDAQGRFFLTGAPFTPGQQEQPDSVPILRWDPRAKRADTLAMIKNETRVTQAGSSGNMRVMARVGGGPLTWLQFFSKRRKTDQTRVPTFPQWEIEDAARQCEALFAQRWPLTHAAFVEFGRTAP